VADVVTGGWTPTPIYAQVNDPSPGDSTDVSSNGVPGTGDTFEVRLAPLGRPRTGAHTLTVRIAADGCATVFVSLVQGGTNVVIAAGSYTPSAGFANCVLHLTSAQIDRITNYNNLVVRVTVLCCDDHSSSSSSSTAALSSSSSSSSSGSSESSSGSSASSRSFGSGSKSEGSHGSLSSSSSQSSSGSHRDSSGSSRSGSSQSGSSTGHIFPCCPDAELPDVLYATFSDVSGKCPCLNGLVVEMRYNAGQYNGASSCNGHDFNLKLHCIFQGGQWIWFIDTDTACSLGQAATSTVCVPFALTFTGVAVDNPFVHDCCPPSGGIVDIFVTG
jgi:hypothetical protein